ncbi:hypothetical protein BN1184_BT_00260 [Pantoea ananatis]|nr:hypothetical protein BN1184_BT_00260 [Pantoea ananatis]
MKTFSFIKKYKNSKVFKNVPIISPFNYSVCFKKAPLSGCWHAHA